MKFFRRSKKSASEPKSSKKTPQAQASDIIERNKYRLYNPRLDQQFNYAAERGHVFAPWLELPSPILERVFSFVCPHTSDESYETCERSAVEDACMLCDLRDIAHAGLVCKRWRRSAIQLMYRSIRIDSVHYCEREIDLSERRKRKSRFDRNGVPEDPAGARLHLLCRTLRDDPTRLGRLVQYFKTPYMVRESSAPLLARTIAVLPNLKYVDLPEGLFMDDPAHHTLKLEVQARCPNLRKMTYLAGSERTLGTLSHGNIWPNLEVLELGRVNMDPAILRRVLATLQHLRALKASDCRMLDDDIFRYNDVLPAFPPLEELVLTDIPRVTSSGLVAYLSRDDIKQSLKVLSLTNTGVHPSTLHDVLANAPRLVTLAITEEVDSPFPSHGVPIPPLSNWALETLRYEITGSPVTSTYASTTASYYNYLASSLFAGGLPRLAAIYVRDQQFPDLLLGLPPPMPGFAGAPQRPSSSGSTGMFNAGGRSLSPSSAGGFGNPPPRFSSNNPFVSAFNGPRGPGILALNQTLEIFTKGEDDIDWGSTRMDPFDARGSGGPGRGRHGRTGSSASGRPLSSYGLSDIGAGWQAGGGARMSVIQGDGQGGFLSVPGDVMRGHGRKNSTSSFGPSRDEWPRPNSSQGPKKGDRDLWR
ncbi:putative F-box domain-containing protein [Rosellinia necatrix]|uniref:Putative F-box domain-containing protein n=1 Tax=Rosellinia necatrix TaxID=77044 RepID=A0A1W2TL87_ROSNE|nr:putative F-box domain-containing protein [Rosellinia necatrix]